MSDEALSLFDEPTETIPVGTHEEEELLRQQAEANGELDHIHPQLRRLAVRIIRLNPDPINAQEHDPRNLESIAESFKAFGQRSPLTVNWKDPLIPGRITVGNGRFTVGKMMGWKWMAVIGTDDAPLDALAYGHIDNRTSALARPNYGQTSKNMKLLQEAGHPLLSIMYTDEEALPLLREDFIPSEISDEKFGTSVLRGRAVKAITAAERVVVDQAITICRAENSKALTEGQCLEMMCRIYLQIKGQKVIEATAEQTEAAAVAEEETDEEALLLD